MYQYNTELNAKNAWIIDQIFIALLMLFPLLSCLAQTNHNEQKSSEYNIERSVVVETKCKDDNHFGSGVIITSNMVLTAAHLYREGCERTVYRPGEEEKDVEIIKQDLDKDLMLLRLNDNYSAEPIFIRNPEVGDRVVVVGFPGMSLDPDNRHLSVSYGNVNTLNLNGVHRIDASIWYGSSGSPVYDENGNLIGIAIGGNPKSHFYYMATAKNVRAFLYDEG